MSLHRPRPRNRVGPTVWERPSFDFAIDIGQHHRVSARNVSRTRTTNEDDFDAPGVGRAVFLSVPAVKTPGLVL
jgi:hypothetical protein